MGVTSLTAHYSMGRALSLGDASFVLPIDFLRLPFIAVVALLLYGEPIDGWTMLGAAAHLRRQLLERPRGDAGDRAPAPRGAELDATLTRGYTFS